ncbi:ribosome biogenesis GTPase YlqF [Petroclostridium sp. X23]|uniref:ribosome biogenesis GTPase YlqF n=1 Tax=Petroclostridium sp. X23 TaxID=3045146 RepID=UPI0024AE04CC|nr:ribosome biogenesis GTPase YlqF [Petroclostridium sp. X23]WHH59428.1 ribosome biogenesis GTPase YlqF [Petroclostridium sp. X23]
MNIQWYPGHMAKTRRIMQESLKLVDIVIELVDARLPLSSRNPDIDNIVGNKPRLMVMNKSDIADPTLNKAWMAWFNKNNINVILADSITGKGLNQISDYCREILKEKIERETSKGMVNRAIKLMVVGIPNVGKSSFINKLAGRASAKTGDRPGVTRGQQWIRLKSGFELLDTPGILWPKFEDVQIGRKLAYTGAIKDEIMDIEELTCSLLEFLRNNYPEKLKERYKLNEISDLSGYELLTNIGKKRGCIVSGGEIDTFRAAGIILDEFRGAKIGSMTLEKPI